jgi:predicted XRE-type DNA-binding protein
MNEKKKKASVRLQYQILQMKKHIQKHQISYSDIGKDCGIHAKNVSNFINGVTKGGNALTFLMIAESIGYEIEVKLKK